MFTNIGRKIKILALVTFALCAISSFIGGIVLLSLDDSLIGAGVATMIIGPLAAWIGSFALYGYGELIEKTCSIESMLAENAQGRIPTQAPQQNNYSAGYSNQGYQPHYQTQSKVQKATHLYEQGIITKEELDSILKGY